MAKMQIEPQDRARVKLECLRMLATLHLDPARSEFIGGSMETYLELNAVETAQYEEKFGALPSEEKEEVLEVMTSWKREGLEQDLEQGLEQGRQEGALHFVSCLLRVGELPPHVEERLRALSTLELEIVGESLLGFSDVAEVESWLENHAVEN